MIVRGVRVVQPHHVSDAMLKRMIKRQIIPLTDISPDKSLKDSAFDSIEELKIANTVNSLLFNDWLIIADKQKDNVYFFKFKEYQYIPHQAHLYIKHFAKVSHMVKRPISSFNGNVRSEILDTDHLDVVKGDTTAYVLEKFQNELKLHKFKETNLKKNARKNREVIPKTITPKIKPRTYRNGPVKTVVRVSLPSKNNSNHPVRTITQLNTLSKKAAKRQEEIMKKNSQSARAIPNISSYNDNQIKDNR